MTETVCGNGRESASNGSKLVDLNNSENNGHEATKTIPLKVDDTAAYVPSGIGLLKP